MLLDGVLGELIEYVVKLSKSCPPTPRIWPTMVLGTSGAYDLFNKIALLVGK